MPCGCHKPRRGETNVERFHCVIRGTQNGAQDEVSRKKEVVRAGSTEGTYGCHTDE